MESGGKAVTKRYRKKSTVVLSLVLPVILLFAILNCFTTYVFYEDYKYKMNLMTEIAAKEEFSGLDAVSELLKDKDIEMLRFFENVPSCYKTLMYHNHLVFSSDISLRTF